jgi:hypothetical protein
MDVVCRCRQITVYVNGGKVNEGFEAHPDSGRILIQTELAELWVRRWELWPLGKAPGLERVEGTTIYIDRDLGESSDPF